MLPVEVWDIVLGWLPTDKRHVAARVCSWWRALLLRRRRRITRPYDLPDVLKIADFWSLSGAPFMPGDLRDLRNALMGPILDSDSIQLVQVIYRNKKILLNWRPLINRIRSVAMLRFLMSNMSKVTKVAAAIQLDDWDLMEAEKQPKVIRTALFRCDRCSLRMARHFYGLGVAVPPMLLSAEDLRTLVNEVGGAKFNINTVSSREHFRILRPYHEAARADIVGAFASVAPRGRWERMMLHHACKADNLELVAYLDGGEGLLSVAISYGSLRVVQYLVEKHYRCETPILNIAKNGKELVHLILDKVLESDRGLLLCISEDLPPEAAATLALRDARIVPHVARFASHSYWKRLLRIMPREQLVETANARMRRSRARTLVTFLSMEECVTIVKANDNPVVISEILIRYPKLMRCYNCHGGVIVHLGDSARARILQFEIDHPELIRD